MSSSKEEISDNNHQDHDSHAAAIRNPSTPQKKQPPAPPQQEQQQQQQTTKPRRRSARVLEHDPIVAPGFGTAKDLARLAEQLGLSVQAADDIMRARGEGPSRSSKRGVKADPNEAAAAADPGVWADFLGEEGVSHGNDVSRNNGDGKRTYTLNSQAAANSSASKSKKTKVAAGTLLQAGTLDSTVVGRNRPKLDAVYHCAIPTQVMPQTKIAAVFTGCNSCHSIALGQNGTIYGWGRNETHQLGANLPTNVVLPSVLDVPGSAAGASSSMLQQAATGKGHTLFLMQDGSVHALGANKVGQCGIRTTSDTVPRPKLCVLVNDSNAALEDVVVSSVACGEDFSVLLDSEGFVYSTGSSEFGQLGNGETGEYFLSANKLAFANSSVFMRRSDHWFYIPEAAHGSSSSNQNGVLEVVSVGDIRIQAIACGKHHTIALEAESSEKPRVFTWGCGNYGSLGHGRQVDEYYPRQMQLLPQQCETRGAKIAAGASCNLIQTANGHVYYNGKHRTNSEANMKPVLIDQLANNGHAITTCASGFQTVVCCTDIGITVAWGQGPHGELGLKDQKSSSKPTFVEALSGIPIMGVACGYGHTLFLARDEDKAVKEALKQLPVVKHEDVEALMK